MLLRSRVIALVLIPVGLLLAASASAQILNTLSGFEHRPGWQGQASAFLMMSGGNTELDKTDRC